MWGTYELLLMLARLKASFVINKILIVKSLRDSKKGGTDGQKEANIGRRVMYSKPTRATLLFLDDFGSSKGIRRSRVAGSR